MKKYLFLILFVISIQMIGQNIPDELSISCTTSCCTSNNSQQAPATVNCHSSSYDTYASKFIPTETQESIFVRVNFIFLQRDDGSGNFHKDSVEQQEVLDTSVSWLNYIYSHLSMPDNTCTHKSGGFIPDIKIKFLVNKVYIKDSYAWNNRNNPDDIQCPDDTNWHLYYLDNQINNDPAIQEE